MTVALVAANSVTNGMVQVLLDDFRLNVVFICPRSCPQVLVDFRYTSSDMVCHAEVFLNRGAFERREKAGCLCDVEVSLTGWLAESSSLSADQKARPPPKTRKKVAGLESSSSTGKSGFVSGSRPQLLRPTIWHTVEADDG